MSVEQRPTPGAATLAAPHDPIRRNRSAHAVDSEQRFKSPPTPAISRLLSCPTQMHLCDARRGAVLGLSLTHRMRSDTVRSSA